MELSKGCPIFKWHGAEKVRRSNDRNAVMARSNLQYEVTSATSRKRKADLIKPKRLPRKVDEILNALLARFGFGFPSRSPRFNHEENNGSMATGRTGSDLRQGRLYLASRQQMGRADFMDRRSG